MMILNFAIEIFAAILPEENFDQSWGGLPVVIFLGDDVQLSPVLDSPVYNSSSKLPAALLGVLVWKDFKYSVNLKTIVRQGIKE
jgi:hypothetical protein